MEMCDDSCQLWVTNWCESAWVQMTDPDNKSRMNIGCITQAPFGNAIWKLILCPICRMLALERPYGWYHQHQNHFISLWVSLCDGGNNVFLFFFFPGDMASAAQPSDGIGLVSFSSFSHFATLGRGRPLHPCFGRWVQDKRCVEIHWGKVCFVGFTDFSSRERGDRLLLFIYSLP